MPFIPSFTRYHIYITFEIRKLILKFLLLLKVNIPQSRGEELLELGTKYLSQAPFERQLVTSAIIV